MKLPIPYSVFEQHVCVLGKTRSGKSSAMRLFVEQLLRKKQPVCIVDPKGDWWGIKLAKDGKHAGFPVVIFGGSHADVPINEYAGAAVAELVATGNRPTLIDLGGWMPENRTKFWIDFASTLFKRTTGERHLVIDEVHNFAFKAKVMSPQAGMMLHWTNRIASEGLGKGVRMIIASQRPQKVHNDTLTSCETLIAMRVIHPADRGAYEDWIDGNGDSSGAEIMKSVANLERGEAWAWSPEYKFGPKRVQFPMFETYDSFRPQTAKDAKRLRGWASVDLDDVREKMKTYVEEAKKSDPAELRKEIMRLQADHKKALAELVGAKRPLVVTEEKKPKIELVEVPMLGKRERKLLDKIAKAQDDLSMHISRVFGISTDAFSKAEKTASETQKMIARVSEHVARVEAARRPLMPSRTDMAAAAKPGGTVRATASRTDPEINAYRGKPEGVKAAGSANGNGPDEGASKRLLVALAQHGELPSVKLRVLARIGSVHTFRKYIGNHRAAGLVEGKDPIRITDAGLRALGTYEPLPTGRELVERWKGELGSGVLRNIFVVLLDNAGSAVDYDSLGKAAGTDSVHTLRKYLGRLRTYGLVQNENGGVRVAREFENL